MQRLQVRFTLAFISVVLLMVLLPFILSGIFRILGVFQPEIRIGQIIDQFPPEEVHLVAEFFRAAFMRQLFAWLVSGAIISIGAGILLSRTLSAPLIKLTHAARAIGAKDLSRRVEVKGSEEIETLAASFNEMAAKLEHAETLRNNLLADVAHELRTPLTVIQGNLRAILDDVYPLEKDEIARLYEQTNHLTRLIEDLRELSHAEAEQLPLNLVEVDVAALVKETAVTFIPLLKAANITLRAEPLGALPHITADHSRLRQSLHNLLNNALQHTTSGDTITLQAEQVGAIVELRVYDTGDGIAPEHLAHVFDRFYRLDKAQSRDKGGSGLGLAIVRAIAQAHGGQAVVASKGAGEGSAFTISLPIKQIST
jgi:signal transduction histidine kinase